MTTQTTSPLEKETWSLIQAMLGPLLLDTLARPDVWEVNRNSDEQVFIRSVHGKEKAPFALASEKIRTIVNIMANYLNVPCNAESPIISGAFPVSKMRFSAFIPPLVSSPAISIRKRADTIYSLNDYLVQESLSSSQYELLERTVRAGRNILVSGATGSGKTTFLNACLGVLEGNFEERVIIIQDSEELQCKAVDVVYATTYDAVGIARAIRGSLRMCPSRIIIGEIRDSDAIELVKSWNTGHGGMATIHADSAQRALQKLEEFMREKQQHPSRRQIAESVALVVHLAATVTPSGITRKVTQMIEVEGVDSKGNYQTREVA